MGAKHQDLQIFGPKLNIINMSNFQPLVVVGLDFKTQLQVGQNLNYI